MRRRKFRGRSPKRRVFSRGKRRSRSRGRRRSSGGRLRIGFRM